RIAVMSMGLLQQVGSPQELYDRPRNRFVAGFIGSPSMNFMEVPASEGGTKLAKGGISFEIPEQYRSAVAGSGTTVVAGFRPEHLELGEVAGPVGTVEGVADVVEYLGNEELLHVTVDGADIVAIVDSSHRVRPGDVISLKIPLEKLHLFAAGDNGENLTLAARSAAAAAA
ncbi:MAG TPA: TOBE domain-containing protein, partial [Candidatus Limnocylindrales bacterium]|nr:TOBE domain-containing protein [Candidatus Limnocylindrales bacterium]